MLEVGQKAPLFVLKNQDDKNISLSDLATFFFEAFFEVTFFFEAFFLGVADSIFRISCSTLNNSFLNAFFLVFFTAN